jgi:uncharacterized Tic20 family protein
MPSYLNKLNLMKVYQVYGETAVNNYLRHRAVACHLAGFTWIPIIISIFAAIPILNKNFNWFFMALLILPALGMFSASLLTILAWQTNRNFHSFVDQSGQAASNFMLSCSLYLFFIVALVGMTYGVATLGGGLFPAATALGGLALILEPILLFTHFCCTINSAIFAWQYKIYNYPLTIQFIKKTS